jgi:hypothetical protein
MQATAATDQAAWIFQSVKVRDGSAAQVFTVSSALGFAEAERCQATTLILRD